MAQLDTGTKLAWETSGTQHCRLTGWSNSSKTTGVPSFAYVRRSSLTELQAISTILYEEKVKVALNTFGQWSVDIPAKQIFSQG